MITIPTGDLVADADHHWSARAACAGNPNLWCADSVQARQHAAHVCLRHCPVYAQCRADADRAGPDRRVGVVVAGVAYGWSGKPREHLAPAANCGLCRGPGDCPASIHGSLRAYQDHGCRCPEAVELKRAHWRRVEQARRERRRLARTAA